MQVITLRGPDQIRPFLEDIARLRIAVFREWPYLYDGTMEEEEKYLGHFASSPHAVIGIARENDEIVGATTAEPFSSAHGDFRAPFEAADMKTEKIFYFGESILLPEYRGLGVGHAFFDLREAAARDWGADMTAFCAVQRPASHPAKPADYRPLDAFWQGRGYEKRDDLVCSFSWKDVGAATESRKPMTFWVRAL
ncbi:GNAT family N-acetyltransferase [Ponticaulis sp.]|uniref:GNAT family N-acetyltransferase n=1 Tax=Ponticaulis sp. TaxID=2020902 RepID=UPI000B74C8A8|nr:GNAT family N-acetyltransferase [Ponticaulis sp.]MAI89146.1 GNAT family N-acetyltransferase [Ponticaulis sp.]OUY01145.1 MAG: GNAT family N-acetyltransferase [Hyphomonadaceae bacterium TMED5]